MTKKNKSKRNNKQDYFPSLYMMLDDYPNIYTTGGTISNMYTLNISSPQLSSSGLPSSYQTGAKYGNNGGTSSSSGGGLVDTIIGAGMGAIGNIGGNLISGGKSSGVGNTIGDIGNTVGGAAMMVNPIAGGAIMLGSNIIGGGLNATFGSKLNKERIAQALNEIDRAESFNINASSFEDLSLQIANLPTITAFNQEDIGSDGWFSNKAKNKYKELLAQKLFAENWVDKSIVNNATALQLNLANNLLANYSAYGGPLDYNYGFGEGAIGYDLANKQLGIDSIKAMGLNRQYSLPNLGLNTFAEGGKIYIKPSKRGTFTAAAKKRGKGVQEFASLVLANKENYSPAMVKKAQFAKNSAGWHHAFGGDLLTNGTVFSNNVNIIGNGGTHEQSPYEGVQVGVDNLGIPNLVELDEVIWNDYVFSNRIPVPNTVRNKYKLRGTKDMSFSDAAKKVLKASEERPNDPIAKDTLDVNLSRLALEQESIRELKNMNNKNKFAKGGYATYLRYAPVLGSTLGLGLTLFSSPDYSRADALALYAENAGQYMPVSYNPIDTMMTYRPIDLDYLANKAAALAAATRRNVMNTSGGNRAAAVGSLLAADYNSLIALGEALRQGDEANWNRLMQTKTFNRGTKQANAEMALKAAMANQEARLKSSQLGLSGYTTAMLMKDAIDALRNASINANLSSLFESLGNIGIDEYNRADRDRLIKDGVFGTLSEKPQEWSLKRWEDYRKALNGTGYRNGGKLNKKKRGGFTY